MGIFSKSEPTWEEVIKFLNEHSGEIDDVIAEDIMKVIVKSKSNKVLYYRVNDADS